MGNLELDKIISLTSPVRVNMSPMERGTARRVNSMLTRHPLSRLLTPATIGGKAFSLYRMAQMGLRVPTACVLSLGVWEDWRAASPASQDGLLHSHCGTVLTFAARYMAPTPVAVRSGAPISMPGMMDTLLNIEPTTGAVATAVRSIYESFDAPRCKAYRKRRGIGEIGTAVIIQAMVVNSRLENKIPFGAGVAFSLDPVTGRGWGLFGEVVVGHTGDKLVGGKVEPVPISKWRGTHVRLYDSLRVTLGALENEWGTPVEVEFAWHGSTLYYLQCRSAQERSTSPTVEVEYQGKRLLGRGRPASQGIVTGVVATASRFEQGGIWVAPMTTPEDYTFMEVSRGIVTLMGGTTCHAAVVAREMKLPCVVGYNGETLLPGMEVLVDGSRGEVYAA